MSNFLFVVRSVQALVEDQRIIPGDLTTLTTATTGGLFQAIGYWEYADHIVGHIVTVGTKFEIDEVIHNQLLAGLEVCLYRWGCGANFKKLSLDDILKVLQE